MSSQVLKLVKAEQVIFDNCSTKSGWIRFLTSLGWTRGQIVKYLNDTVLKGKKQIRYQHVRNVLITEVKNPTDKF
jgi:hypothetical protein